MIKFEEFKGLMQTEGKILTEESVKELNKGKKKTDYHWTVGTDFRQRFILLGTKEIQFVQHGISFDDVDLMLCYRSYLSFFTQFKDKVIATTDAKVTIHICDDGTYSLAINNFWSSHENKILEDFE